MAEEKKIGPVKLIPVTVERPWGACTYELADLGVLETEVLDGWLAGNNLEDLMQTFLERLSGDDAFERYGTQFPVMVKKLSVKGDTSLHVNADDETARQRYDAFGKTVLWYVADAGPGARLHLGLRRDVSAAEFYERCLAGTLDEVLMTVKPHKGESFLIPPSMVHGASGPLEIVEISSPSDLFFRVWERNPSQESHLEEAFDLIGLTAGGPKPVHGPGLLARDPHFTVNEIRLEEPLKSHREGDGGAFLVYRCLRGGAVIQSGKGDSTRIAPGELALIPAETEDFFLIPAHADTLLLEITLEPYSEKDSYLPDNPE